VIAAPSVNSFKHRLDKFWANQDIKYSYRADITSDGQPFEVDSDVESGEEDREEGPVPEN
jgi:hypothetical protein